MEDEEEYLLLPEKDEYEIKSDFSKSSLKYKNSKSINE